MSEKKDRLREGKTITNMKDMSESEKQKIKPAPQKGEDIFEVVDGDDLEIEGPTTEEQLEVSNDRYLRLMAEFDNYKKRTLNEKMNLLNISNDKIILDIISILDNFERAEPLSDGMSLIYKDIQNKLKKYDVIEIDCKDKVFNTDEHEAITSLPIVDSRPNSIVEVVEKGYKINDRVIRFAKVVVSK